MFDDDFGGGGSFSSYAPEPVYYELEPTYYEPEPVYYVPEPVFEQPEQPHDDLMAYVTPVAGQGVVFDVTAIGAGHGFAELARVDAEAALEQINAQITAVAQSEPAVPVFWDDDDDVMASSSRYTNVSTPAYRSCPAEVARVKPAARQTETPAYRLRIVRSVRSAGAGHIVEYIRDSINFVGIEQENGWFKPTFFELSVMGDDDLQRLAKGEVRYLRKRRELDPEQIYGDPQQLRLIACEALSDRMCRDFGYVGKYKEYEILAMPTDAESESFTFEKRARLACALDECTERCIEIMNFDH